MAEYGLQGLAKLPLPEQVQRLSHAIQMKYPYKTTEAWKSLSADQKRSMLTFIQDQKAIVSSSEASKDDPYLAMHDAKVEENKRKWIIIDQQFDAKCPVCNESHSKATAADSATIIQAIQAMMVVFGDDSPTQCEKTAQEIYKSVALLYNQELLKQQQHSTTSVSAITISDLSLSFPMQVKCFLRWKAFKSKSNQDGRGLEQDMDDDLSDAEDLANELGSFAENRNGTSAAVPTTPSASSLHSRFIERLGKADFRTRDMDYDNYCAFSTNRRVNFMKSKGKFLREWLGIPAKTSPTVLQCINFIAYDLVGRIVEEALIDNASKTAAAALRTEDIVSATNRLASVTAAAVVTSDKSASSEKRKKDETEHRSTRPKRLRSLRK